MMIDLFYVIFLAVFIIQMGLFGYVFQRINLAYTPDLKHNLPPVTVIICAQNEAQNLESNLPQVLQQEYPKFEVLVVNDQSMDTTQSVLDEMKDKYHNLKTIKSKKPEHLKGKKFALRKGIKHAKYDHILLSDADCIPATRFWIRSMLEVYDSSTSIVLGCSPYTKEKGLVNRFARFETLYTALIYGSSALIGLPYMGVGRNLSYNRSKLNWDILNDSSTISGDDDLMVNAHATETNTKVQFDPEAMTFSKAPNDWSGFFRQKLRHVSTGKKYRFKHIAWLNLINGSQGLFYVLFFLGLYWFPIFALLAYILRMIMVFRVYIPFMKRTKSEDLIYFIFVLDPLLSIYQLLMAPFLFVKSKNWN